MIGKVVLGAAGVVCCFAAASAHVTLEKSQTPIGAPYKAVLRVPHGCEGSATTALRIRVPDGMIAVKPMPKPGWKVETVIGKYQKSYDYFHGAKLSEGVVEISFTGATFPTPITMNSSSPALLSAISNPGQPCTCPSCRNARRASTAGSRSRLTASHRAITPSLLQR